ncbi:MAG: hypothetical protein IPI32_06585 [Austwickia sp.]|nr:hypothetical protein [Austwickia sp.]
MTSISDSHLARSLAAIGRQFDRARDALVVADEPGEHEVVADKPADTADESQGPLSRVAGGLAAVAGAGARAITGTVHPRHEDWDEADADTRIAWWVDRFGTAGAAVAALPALTGRLGTVSGAGDVIGAAAQVLLVNAVGRELGVGDLNARTAVAAQVVLGRELSAAQVSELLASDPADDPTTDPNDPSDDEHSHGVLARLGGTGALVWRAARQMLGLRHEIDSRPRGGRLARAARNLPVVGVAGGFIAERSGMRQVADAARAAYPTSP